MLPNFVQRMRAKPASLALLASLTLAQAACGGGSGSPGANNVPPELKVTVVNADGAAVNTVSTTSGAFARATVKDFAGRGVANVAVQFAASGIAFTPSTGTALTNDAGVATVGILASGAVGTGAVVIIASARADNQPVTGQIGVAITVP